MNGEPDLRKQLEAFLSPAVVDAIEHLVAECVRVELDAAGAADGSPWMSIASAAEYAGVSQSTIERAIRRNRLRSTTIGRRRLIHRDELEKAATGEDVAPTTSPRRRAE